MPSPTCSISTWSRENPGKLKTRFPKIQHYRPCFKKVSAHALPERSPIEQRHPQTIHLPRLNKSTITTYIRPTQHRHRERTVLLLIMQPRRERRINLPHQIKKRCVGLVSH